MAGAGRARPLLRVQELRAGDEVGEGVHLLHHPPVVVPGLAQVAPAADVGDGHHEAAVEQGQAVRGEGHRVGEAVGAVGGEEERRPSVARQALLVDEGDRDLHPVLGGGEHPLRGVPRGVVAARDLLLLQQGGGPLLRVVVEDRARGHERLVGVAEDLGVELGVLPREGRVGGLGEGDAVPLARAQVGDPRAGAGRSRARRPPRSPGRSPCPPASRPGGGAATSTQLSRPGFATGAFTRRKLRPGVVGADVEVVAVVVEVVLLLGDAGGHRPELPRRARSRAGSGPRRW